ncbi:hypothetical protein H5410_030532, partial [Solanum commersonii]
MQGRQRSVVFTHCIKSLRALDHNIILNDEVKPPLKKSIHFEQVFKFVNKIKVAVLLNDCPDLLDEFYGFLQDSVTTY